MFSSFEPKILTIINDPAWSITPNVISQSDIFANAFSMSLMNLFVCWTLNNDSSLYYTGWCMQLDADDFLESSKKQEMLKNPVDGWNVSRGTFPHNLESFLWSSSLLSFQMGTHNFVNDISSYMTEKKVLIFTTKITRNIANWSGWWSRKNSGWLTLHSFSHERRVSTCNSKGF